MLSSESTAHFLASTPFSWADHISNSPTWTLDAVTSVKGLVLRPRFFLMASCASNMVPCATLVNDSGAVQFIMKCTCGGYAIIHGFSSCCRNMLSPETTRPEGTPHRLLTGDNKESHLGYTVMLQAH